MTIKRGDILTIADDKGQAAQAAVSDIWLNRQRQPRFAVEINDIPVVFSGESFEDVNGLGLNCNK